MCFFFSSRRRHTRYWRDWSSDVCSSDLRTGGAASRFGPGMPVLAVVGLWLGLVAWRPLALGFYHDDWWAIDRKSVVQGKSVDLGGRRIIKKKHKTYIT